LSPKEDVFLTKKTMNVIADLMQGCSNVNLWILCLVNSY